MTDDVWPPPGHSMFYRMTMDSSETEPYRDINYEVDITVVGDRPIDLATLRWGRLGGPNALDLEFRAELYQVIGEIAVAGGHAEMAMKRVLVVAEEKQAIADVEDSWGNLEKRLRKVAGSNHAYAFRLSEIITWAKQVGVKIRRDNVIHASWVNFSGTAVQRGRFTLKGESKTIYGSIRELEKDARLVFEYAQRLDDLVVSDWPQARLPRAETSE